MTFIRGSGQLVRVWAKLILHFNISLDIDLLSQTSHLHRIRSAVCSYHAQKMWDDVAEKYNMGPGKKISLAFKNYTTLSKSISTVEWRLIVIYHYISTHHHPVKREFGEPKEKLDVYIL